MTQEKIDLLQEHLNEKVLECSKTCFMQTLQHAAIRTFGKKKKQSSDWFDENDLEIRNLLKNKHHSRQEIQKRICAMKNDWFLTKAKEAQAYHDQKKLGEFYATVREVHGLISRNTN